MLLKLAKSVLHSKFAQMYLFIYLFINKSMHHEEKHPQCCAGLDVLCKQKNLHQTAPQGSSEQPDEAGTDA